MVQPLTYALIVQVGVEISTKQDPSSFDDFTSNGTSSGEVQYARNFASGEGTGLFCIPLDLSNTGIDGVKDGANVTLQFIYDGGDDKLYQVCCSTAICRRSFG